MHQQLHIDNGQLMIPMGGGYLGIPLWLVAAAVIAFSGLMVLVVVLMAAMSSGRRETISR